jgi:hypothetical protein
MSFVQFINYGLMQQFDASQSGGIHRGYQKSDDHIYVFLNYKQVGKFKDKESANQCICELIKNAPKESQKDLEEYKKLILS